MIPDDAGFKTGGWDMNKYRQHARDDDIAMRNAEERTYQVIPDEAVEAAVSVDALESLETPCDIGRLWDMGRGGTDEPTCSNAAEWSALAHDCHMGRPILLCTKHLAMGREDRRPEQFIKWRCSRCKLVAVSADELIWNVRRLT